MTVSAYEWGIRYESCHDALEQREALGPNKTQADWWRACSRGDWLIWQLQKLPRDQLEPLAPALNRALEKIVARAIRRGQKALHGIREAWATKWRKWANKWLSGEDRSAARAARAEGEVWEVWAAMAVEAAAIAAMAARAAARAVEAAAMAARAAMAVEAVEAAVEAAAEAAWAAKAAEQRLQALDIRKEIPTWPGVIS